MRALVLALSLLLFGSSLAEARRVDSRFLMDFAPGLAVPIADRPWRDYTGPSFKFSLRVGGELWVARGFGIAGEFDLDPEPLMRSDGHVLGRFRGLIGLRLLFGFGVGAFYIRHAMGVDYINDIQTSLDARAGSAALAVEPGVGVQFRVVRHLVVGFDVAFPMAFYYNFAADAHFLGFIGIRF